MTTEQRIVATRKERDDFVRDMQNKVNKYSKRAKRTPEYATYIESCRALYESYQILIIKLIAKQAREQETKPATVREAYVTVIERSI